jgi:hypothetical protein
MASPHVSHRTTRTVKILPTGLGKWTATMQTPGGPMTAIGDSIAEAKAELDRLIVIARALELTHRHRDQ